MLYLRTYIQELYAHYSQQVRDTSIGLADGHKAYLLRKAVHYFNTHRMHAKSGPGNDSRAPAARRPCIEVWLAVGPKHG
jgi:hypothetical protein